MMRCKTCKQNFPVYFFSIFFLIGSFGEVILKNLLTREETNEIRQQIQPLLNEQTGAEFSSLPWVFGVTVVGKGDVGELILYTHVYMGIINKPLNMEKNMGHFFKDITGEIISFQIWFVCFPSWIVRCNSITQQTFFVTSSLLMASSVIQKSAKFAYLLMFPSVYLLIHNKEVSRNLRPVWLHSKEPMPTLMAQQVATTSKASTRNVSTPWWGRPVHWIRWLHIQ